MDKDSVEFQPTIDDLGVASMEAEGDQKTVRSSSTCPKFSKAFLEYMEHTFDTRKMLAYSMSLEELKGVQSVLDHMRYLYDNNFSLE